MSADTPRIVARRLTAAVLGLSLLAGAPIAAAAEDGDGTTPSDMSVQQAWENAKRDWRALQDASGEAWGEAKREFEESWSELQDVLRESGEDAPPPPSAAPEGEGGG